MGPAAFSSMNRQIASKRTFFSMHFCIPMRIHSTIYNIFFRKGSGCLEHTSELDFTDQSLEISMEMSLFTKNQRSQNCLKYLTDLRWVLQ